MSRYIDADALKRRVGELIVPEWARTLIRTWLESAPTVDSVPVVHGYWRPHPLGYTSNLVKYEEWDVCSNCGIGTKRRNMTDDFFEEYSYSYCPNCGAKMDGKENANDAIRPN